MNAECTKKISVKYTFIITPVLSQPPSLGGNGNVFSFPFHHFVYCFYNMVGIQSIFFHQVGGFSAFSERIVYSNVFHWNRVMLHQLLCDAVTQTPKPVMFLSTH